MSAATRSAAGCARTAPARARTKGGVRVPDEMEQARAHAIQEELRRREAEKSRPQPELDYIERLLRQF